MKVSAAKIFNELTHTKIVNIKLKIIGSMDRQKNYVLTEIFSQAHERPLAMGREIP